jgi:hypothetical protein
MEFLAQSMHEARCAVMSARAICVAAVIEATDSRFYTSIRQRFTAPSVRRRTADFACALNSLVPF